MDRDQVICYLFQNFVDREKWKAELHRLRLLSSEHEPITWSDDDIRASAVVCVVASAIVKHGSH